MFIINKIETCALCQAKKGCTFLCKPMEALLEVNLNEGRKYKDKTIKKMEALTNPQEIDGYQQPDICRGKMPRRQYEDYAIVNRGRQKAKFHSDDPS